MFAGRSRELGHSTLRKARSIGGARVERSHAATLPTEDRFKLGDGRAVLGRTRRADFANAVRRLRYAGRAARFPEGVAEGLLRQRLAALATDERKLAARPCRQRSGERRQNRNSDGYAGLLGSDHRNPIPNMLPPELYGIATA